MTRVVWTVVVAMLAVACGSGATSTAATVDGVVIERAALEGLHPDLSSMSPRDVASSMLLLIIHQAFTAEAETGLGIVVSDDAATAAFEERTRSAVALGDLDQVLANRRITRDRVRLEAELDVLRSVVGPELVRHEAPGFDMDAAYSAYLLANGRACVRQILLTDTQRVDDLVARVNNGESFDALAREFSLDNLVQRPAGESGAGGDMGCGPPSTFGLGIADAAIDQTIPVGEAFGPVISDRGLHVVVVYERDLPSLDGNRAAVVEAAISEQSTAVFTRWGADILRSTEVTIDEELGTWEAAEGTDGIPTVVPPGG